MTDTHSHLYEPEYDDDREEAVARALAAGVSRMFLPNINRESVPRMMEMVEHHPDCCFPMMGLHPEEVKNDWESELDWMEGKLEGMSAVGEVGLDFYWDTTFREEQIKAFERQMAWAADLNLPLIIHQRKAENEMLAVMDAHGAKEMRGIFHCFSGSAESAMRLLRYEGFCLGIGGVVTFKNARLGDALREVVPLERVVLETDCPYLAPTPHRGKRNESSYLTLVRDRVAEIYGVSAQEVERVTDNNATRIFCT